MWAHRGDSLARRTSAWGGEPLLTGDGEPEVRPRRPHPESCRPGPDAVERSVREGTVSTNKTRHEGEGGRAVWLCGNVEISHPGAGLPVDHVWASSPFAFSVHSLWGQFRTHHLEPCRGGFGPCSPGGRCVPRASKGGGAGKRQEGSAPRWSCDPQLELTWLLRCVVPVFSCH